MKRYIISHWRGEFGILKSFLLNGIAMYFGIIVIFSFVYAVFIPLLHNNKLSINVIISLFLIFITWSLVGITRSGIKHATKSGNSAILRISGVASILFSLLIIFLTLKDVMILFGIHL